MQKVRVFGVALLAGAVFGVASCGSPAAPITPPPTPGAPTVTCPASVVATTSTDTTAVTFDAPVTSGGLAPLTTTCSVISGARFPVGTTAVTCTVSDALARTASCGFNITLTLKVFTRYTNYWAFGDSLTEGKVTTGSFNLLVDFPGSYPTVLRGLLPGRYTQQTFAVQNWGKGGAFADTDSQCLRDLLSVNAPPEVLLLLEGANDMLRQDDLLVSYILPALTEDIRIARDRGVKDVMLATLPPSRPGSNGSKVAPYIVPVNAQIRSLASLMGVGLVDLYAAMVGQEQSLVGDDGLHLTPAGYQKMAETFFATIKGRLEQSTPPAGSFLPSGYVIPACRAQSQ